LKSSNGEMDSNPDIEIASNKFRDWFISVFIGVIV
jgi:hypothetical protein